MAISKHSREQRSRKTEASLKEAKKTFKKFENFENAIFLKKVSSKNANRQMEVWSPPQMQWSFRSQYYSQYYGREIEILSPNKD